MTPDRYRAWLQLLVDGNQNMIRVWGGGIYEADAFYDICDGNSLELCTSTHSDQLCRTRDTSMAGLHVWLWTGDLHRLDY